MESRPRVEEVSLAGLLHDIGKLIQRAEPGGMPKALRERASDLLPVRQGRHSHWHALWSDHFFDLCERGELRWPRGVDRAWVRNLAVYHHRPLQDYRVRPELALSVLVTIADRAASGFERKERDAEAEADWEARSDVRRRFRQTPIEAIVSHVRIERREAPQRRYHAPVPLGPDALLPMPSDRVSVADVEKGYAGLWEAFREAWNDAARRCDNDPGAFEEAVLSLSERFLWAVPSSTRDQPDVSLHDHGRAVAAFAAALFRWHEEGGTLTDGEALGNREAPSFRFLVGDLSGLQSTLFRLRSEGVPGLNKTLRGRSLRFQLIADAAARRALAEFGMPMSAALQTAGGRFLLVVPALGDAEERLARLRAEAEAWLLAQYTGELGLGLALSEPFSAEDLMSKIEEAEKGDATQISRARAELAIAQETAKLRLFGNGVEKGILDCTFPHGPCAACGVRPATAADTKCSACAEEHALGEVMPRSRAIVVGEPHALGDRASRLWAYDYLLPTGGGDERHDRGHGWRWMLADAEHGPAPVRPGPAWVARFPDPLPEEYADLEDVEPGGTKTFEALARDAREKVAEKPVGRELLALLKGDVDQLGLIFAEGLGARWSIARQAALSRMLDAYFNLRLPDLLRRGFPDSYTVYAGGDDFLLVLPWRQGFDLAKRLREDFRTFVGENPSLTFSLGIALFQPHTPISLAAREAEERLERAKEAGRNRVSAIEAEPMTWEAFARALEKAERLNGHLRSGAVSTGLLYRLLALDEARRRTGTKRARPVDYTWMARLGYQLARNVKDEAIRDQLRELFGLDTDWRGGGTPPPGLRLAITHALYRNR